jgi:gliding motility-associated-like protein
MSVRIIQLSLVVLFCSGTLGAQEAPIFKWAKKVLKPSCTAGALNTITTTDGAGNVYTMGAFCGTVDFDPGTGVSNLTSDNTPDDIFLVKFDPDGNFVWAVKLGDPFRADNGTAIAIDASGNVFATGSSEFGFNDYNTLICKIDATGNLLWTKKIHTVTPLGRSVALDQSGNLLITAGFMGTVDFDPGAGVYNLVSTGSTGSDLAVLKLDNDGNFLWAKKTGGTGGEVGLSIRTDASGNIIIGGYYFGTDPADFDPGPGVFNLTSAGNMDVFILKLDVNGDFVWARSMGGTEEDKLTSIAVNTAGTIFATGFFKGSGDYNPDAGIVNLTSVSSFTSDIFLVRLNADGSFGWASGFGGADDDEGRAIAADASGNLLFTGFFNNTVDFDPGPGVRNLVSNGQNLYPSMFIAKLDESEGLVWAQEIMGTGSSSAVRSNGIAISSNGDISLGGIIWGGADFDFGLCDTDLGHNPYAAFVMKITTGTPGPPTITSFTPSSGVAGTPVVITGTNFSTIPSENDVRWNVTSKAVVTASTATSITTTVPANAVTGKIYIKVGCHPFINSTETFTVGPALTPTITSFTPSSGPTGITVTITGTNFSTTPASNTVQFNGTTAVVSASTATSITTTVPAGATTGKITVTVSGNTATSASNFTVTAPGTITFTTQPVDRIVCAGATTTFSLTATGDTNLLYQWQINNAGFADLANNATYSGVNSATLTITSPTVALNGKVYRCLVRGDNTTNTSSASVTLTVNTTPAAPTISAADLGCAPAGTTLSPAGALAGQSYRYYDAATAGNLVGNGTSFNTPLLSASTTYFISTYNTTTLCESTRTPVLVTVQTCNPPSVIATTAGAYLEGIVTVDLNPLISDPDNNVDVSTLQIISQPVSGATATLDALMLTVDYNGLPFPGTDVLRIGVCDLTAICIEQELTIETAGDITVYNALSPNADGKNDTFILRYIDLFTDTQHNNVTIFNRWGDVIFETENYDNKDRVFKGVNKGGSEVPSGTYFYKIEFSSGREAKMGYLLLKR